MVEILILLSLFLFAIGVFIMYFPFYLMGIYDYYLISVIVCIYLVPLSVLLSFIYTLCKTKNRKIKKVYSVLLLLGIIFTVFVYTRYSAISYDNLVNLNIELDLVYESFYKCKHDLEVLASYIDLPSLKDFKHSSIFKESLESIDFSQYDIPYCIVNDIIYVLLYPSIIVFNFYIAHKKNNAIQTYLKQKEND